MTTRSTGDRPRATYWGTPESLANELKLLPPDTVEWKCRIGLLTRQLTAAKPCRNAMRIETRHPDGSVELRHCIEGVITMTAEDNGAIQGQWVVSDYCADPAGFAPDMLPVPVTGNGARLGEPDASQECDATQFEYYVQRDAAHTEEHHRRHNPFSPAQARLWFGIDANPDDGKLRDIDLTKLSRRFRQSTTERWNIEIPDSGSMPEINNFLFDQGVNPLHFAAHLLAESTDIPVPGLWHPHIILMIQQESIESSQ